MTGAELFKVVSESDEAKLGGSFMESSQIEPSEAFILFDIREHCFDLPSLFSFLNPFFAVEEFSDLIFEADKGW